MSTDSLDPPWFIPPKQQDARDENDSEILTAWLEGLHSLHGPPGPHPAQPTPTGLVAPFVEPRTAPFPIHLTARELSVLLRGCAPNVPACPWQDVYEGGAYEEREEAGDVPEHKWVVYATEVDGMVKVQMHRSWTGIKLIELTVDTSPRRCSLDNVPALEDDGASGTSVKSGRIEVDRGPRITDITFETHEDYKLKGADERVYKYVAWEVCWWVLGICLGPETGA